MVQRLIEMRVDEAERTRGVRDKKKKKRADKEMARLQAQYVFLFCMPYSMLLCLFFMLSRKSKVDEYKNGLYMETFCNRCIYLCLLACYCVSCI